MVYVWVSDTKSEILLTLLLETILYKAILAGVTT